MSSFLKIIKWAGIALAIIAIFFIVFVQLSWNKKYDAPYPEVKASTDSSLIARGKYIVYGPAHCATCHVSKDKETEAENGLEIPLTGGREFDLPIGTYYSSNLTPDPETGIGKLTDGEIARTMRHSVGSDGRVIVPFMPFQGLSDEDLTAVISFLRSQEPVKNEVAKTKLNFLGKAIYAFGVLKPEGPKSDPPQKIAIDSTVEYGHYIANYVANCVGCHKARDMKTGEFIGQPFAGGLMLEPEPANKNYGFITPNLTPDKETGIMAHWDEATFIKRFKAGKLLPVMGMPWGSFSRMNEVELKAVYRYLQSLEPVKNKIPKVVFAPGEKFPH